MAHTRTTSNVESLDGYCAGRFVGRAWCRAQRRGMVLGSCTARAKPESGSLRASACERACTAQNCTCCALSARCGARRGGAYVLAVSDRQSNSSSVRDARRAGGDARNRLLSPSATACSALRPARLRLEALARHVGELLPPETSLGGQRNEGWHPVMASSLFSLLNAPRCAGPPPTVRWRAASLQCARARPPTRCLSRSPSPARQRSAPTSASTRCARAPPSVEPRQPPQWSGRPPVRWTRCCPIAAAPRTNARAARAGLWRARRAGRGVQDRRAAAGGRGPQGL